MKTTSVCSSYAPSTTCALPIRISRPNKQDVMEASTLKTPASTRPHLNPAFSYRLCYACTRSYHSADCDMHRQPVNVLQDQDATKEILQLKETRDFLHRRQQNVTAQSHTDVDMRRNSASFSLGEVGNTAEHH